MNQEALAAKTFLVFHDPFTGKPAVGEELLHRGVAAALMADLVLARWVGVEGDHLVVAQPREAEGVGGLVLRRLAAGGGTRTVRSWIDTLGPIVLGPVSGLLVDAGLVRREQGGWGLVGRRPDRFPAVDLVAAASPRLRLERALRAGGALDVHTAVMASLLDALRSSRILDLGPKREHARAAFAAARSRLPGDLLTLVAATEASSGAATVDSYASPIGLMRRPGRR